MSFISLSSVILVVGYGRGESYKEPCVVMDAQIEHQDFTVLALDLVRRLVVCEARPIAYGWNGHGSPPTLEEMDVGSHQKPIGGGWFFLTHFPKRIDSVLTLSKQGVECREKWVIGWCRRIRPGWSWRFRI